MEVPPTALTNPCGVQVSLLTDCLKAVKLDFAHFFVILATSQANLNENSNGSTTVSSQQFSAPYHQP